MAGQQVTMQVSSLDIPTVHNALACVSQAYGQLLQEQERRHAMAIAALREENARLRKELAELGRAEVTKP